MANTPSFNWQTPDDTSLVKDGASAIRTLGNAIDSSMTDLKGGTTGQVLSKASNTDMDFTWVAQDDSNAIQNSIIDAKADLITGTAADTPAILSVGTNGQVLTADSTTATGLKWATPATAFTWTQRLTTQANGLTSVAYNGSNLYVAYGAGGSLFTSSDGITWTSRTSGFGANTIWRVHYASALSLWIAVGANGTITTSSNGTTWTARTANVGTNALYDVDSSGTTVVAVGDGGGTTNTGGITYSTDGITWTRKSQSLTVGTGYLNVVYNGTNWIVSGNNSTNNSLYASTPSGTWTANSSGDGNTIQWMIWTGSTHIYAIDSGAIRTNSSTTLASASRVGMAGNYTVSASIFSNGTGKNQFHLYNGRIYYVDLLGSGTISVNRDFNATVSPNSSTQFSDVGMPYFSPYPINAVTGIWVGAAGRIQVQNAGIFTSF